MRNSVEILRSVGCTWPTLPGLEALHTTEHSQLVQHASRLERQVAELQNRLQSQGNESCTHEVAPHSISPVDYHGELSTDVVLLSMNAAAEPSFIGATSGFSLSRLVEGILSESMLTERVRDNDTTVSSQTPMREQSVASDQEDVLVDTFFKRVHPRYPLLDEVSVQDLFRQTTRDEDHNSPNLFILYMVYAIAARTIQLHPEMRRCTGPEVCHITGAQEKIFSSETRLDILCTCPSPYRLCSSEPQPATGPSPPVNCPLSSPNSQQCVKSWKLAHYWACHPTRG